MNCEAVSLGSVSIRAKLAGLVRTGVAYHLASRWRIAKVRCAECDAVEVTERPDRTARGYRRFRCRACGKQFNPKFPLSNTTNR